MGNTHYEQLLDIKVVTMRKENMLWLQLPKKVYYKTGCTPVALREMKQVYNFKRAFIITDANLYQMGACDAIINQLHDMGIETAEFFDIRVDPQIQDAMKGLPKMHEFEPDVIIAVGGGSAIDTAKIMWIMYENPEEAFLDMATIFLDIRKRIRFFPQMGKKAKLVCIPTTAGTGSECTPFTIISDANTGMKWPLIGYEMMPEMAIIDADNMMKLPPRATQASGYDVLTHAVEAYVSTFATEYTDGFCKEATKMVFDYLPRAYRSAFKGRRRIPWPARRWPTLRPGRNRLRQRIPGNQPLPVPQDRRLVPYSPWHRQRTVVPLCLPLQRPEAPLSHGHVLPIPVSSGL